MNKNMGPVNRLPLTGLAGLKIKLLELIQDPKDFEGVEVDRDSGQVQLCWVNERGEREEWWFELTPGEAPFMRECYCLECTDRVECRDED